MICISIGIALTSTTHYIKTGGGHGLALALLLVVLILYVVIAYLLPALLDPRTDWPGARGKQWIVPVLTVALSLAGMLFLVVAIPAQHRQDDAVNARTYPQAVLPDRR